MYSCHTAARAALDIHDKRTSNEDISPLHGLRCFDKAVSTLPACAVPAKGEQAAQSHPSIYHQRLSNGRATLPAWFKRRCRTAQSAPPGPCPSARTPWKGASPRIKVPMTFLVPTAASTCKQLKESVPKDLLPTCLASPRPQEGHRSATTCLRSPYKASAPASADHDEQCLSVHSRLTLQLQTPNNGFRGLWQPR